MKDILTSINLKEIFTLYFHLHPMLVHFPIALFITVFGFELLSLALKKDSFHNAAWYNYLLAILASGAAILAAWWDGEILKHPVFYTHKNLAYWTFWIAFGSGFVLPVIKRKSKKAFRIIFFIFLVLVATLISITGYYGGKLVYEYGVGVEE